MNFISYKDKICVVTGAASGIGYATTKMLVEDGANVYALDRNPVDLPVVNLYCDLSVKGSIDTCFIHIPDKIDCFFGVAGVSGARDDYYTTFTVNFIANKYITEEYLKDRMKDNGAICYVSSVTGNYWEKYASEFRPFLKAATWDQMVDVLHKKVDENTLGVMAYPLSKRALNYYMALKAIEFGDRGVRVNAVLPAATNTSMLGEFKKELGGLDELFKQTGVSPRLADPDEIAKPMLFLNSDMASYISGTCLTVDFGNDAMVKLGKKRDRLDMKVGSKLFNMGFVQNQFKKQIDSSILDKTSVDRVFDDDGIEII